MIRRRCDTSVLWSMNPHSLNLYAMRLQSMCSTGQLKGNGVLGIRREDKNQWERRVPISPSQAAHLIQRGIKVLVQPSSTRCFTDQSYADVGAEITEDLSGASTIIAVKEVPIPLLIPERTYMMFSHTIKAQEYNMPLLDSILNQSIRLIDYERIVDADGRIVKFGPYAGFAGTIDTLHALGVALLARGFATPFLHISLSKEYTSLEAARKDILQVGAEIREHGLPSEVCPLTVVVTGSGSVSHAVQQILHLLPTKYVECGELSRLWSLRKKDRHNIYVAVATSRDMVTRKDKSSQPFNKTHYYKEPHQYIGTFHERVIPYTRVLINGMYWDTHYPKLLTLQQAKDLKSQGQFPLVALGDITCDPMGSVELLVRSTSIANPFFAFDVVNRCDKEIHQYQPDDVLVLGVDHLPAEFPKEASHEFGKNLVPLLEKVVYSDATAPLTQQEQSLGKELYGATVTSQQKLTPHFEYISSIRAKRAATQSQPRKTSSNAKSKYSVLLIGGGMCAGPVVELLAGTGNVSVTVVDSNRTSLDALLTHYTKRLDGANVRDLVLDVSCEQEQLSKLIKEHDVVVSLLPAFMHGKVVELAVEHRKHVATASYISPEVSALAERAKERGLCIIVEMGLDPGIDIMTSKAMIDGIRAAGGLIRSYKSACGALLAPENSTCPLAYKFSWSPRGVLTALARSARVKENGIWRSVPSPYAEAIPFGDFSGLNLVAVPNGDAEEYAQNLFQLHEETPDIARLTLRYGNFPPAALALNAMQLLSETKDFAELRPGGSPISWAQLVQRLAPAFNAANDLDARTKRDFTKLGILSNECYVPQTKAGTPRDSLSVLLAERLSYAPHERDMVLMVHEVIAEYPNKGGKKALHRGILSARGSSALETGTAITVGIPLALSVCALLNGEVKARGLVRPTEVTLCSSVLSGLKKYNIEMHEEEIPL